MLINFRQGIVNAPANFLQLTGSTVSIALAGQNKVEVAFADGLANYLHTESVPVANAWAGPFVPGTNYWLYWNINVRTGQRTFGHTLVQPIVSPTAPSSPVNDQFWFDTTVNKMRVWNGTASVWQPRLAVFAAYLQSGAVLASMSTNAPSFEGSQISTLQSTSAYTGSILFDVNGDPIKKTNNIFFTTEDEAVTIVSTSARVKMEAILIEAVALTTIPAYSFVKFSDYNQVEHVTNSDLSSIGMYGLVQYPAVQGELVNVVTQGVVTNPDWNWALANAPVNSPLYVDTNGDLTPIQPPNATVVAYVIDINTIMLRPFDVSTTEVQGTGSVTSVNVVGGATGLTTSGGPVTSAGTITLGGTLNIASGGTGQTTANAAFAALSPMTTNGDLITRAGGVPTRLGIGAESDVLTVTGGAVSWQPAAGGGGGGVDVPYTSEIEPSALLLSEYRADDYNPLGGTIQENQIGYLWYDQTTQQPTLKQRMNSFAYCDFETDNGFPWDATSVEWYNYLPLPAPIPTLAEINDNLDRFKSGVYWSNVFGGVNWKIWYFVGNNLTTPVGVTISLLPSATPDYDKARGTGYTVGDVLTVAGLGGTGFTATVDAVLPGGKIDTLTITTPGSGYNAGRFQNVPFIGGTGTGGIAYIGTFGGAVDDVSPDTWDPEYASWREVFDAIETSWVGSKCYLVETPQQGRFRITHNTLDNFSFVHDYNDPDPDADSITTYLEFDQLFAAGGFYTRAIAPRIRGSRRNIWNALNETNAAEYSVVQRSQGRNVHSDTFFHDPVSGGLSLNSGFFVHEHVSNASITKLETYLDYQPGDSELLDNQTVRDEFVSSGEIYLSTKSTKSAKPGDITLECGDTIQMVALGANSGVGIGAEIQLNAGGTYFGANATLANENEQFPGGSILIRGGYSAAESFAGYPHKISNNSPTGTTNPNFALGQFRGGDVELMAGGVIPGFPGVEDGNRGLVKLTAGRVVLGQSHGIRIGGDDFYEQDQRKRQSVSFPGHTMISRGVMGPARWAPQYSSESSYIPEGDSTNVFTQNFTNTTFGTVTTRTSSLAGDVYSLGAQRRLGFATAAGAGSMAGVRGSTALFRGGKFIYHARFAIPTEVSAFYFFVGLAPAGQLANANPATINNIVGLSIAPGTTGRQLVAISNADSQFSSTPMVTDADISLFPQAINFVAGAVYDVVISSTPFGHLLRLARVDVNTGGPSYPGTAFFPSNAAPNWLPVKVAPQIWISNGVTAVATSIDVMFQHINDNVTSF